eukprot:TRINITY_DN82189_c0_g1_i1.p1 TRINITY_DN82189_c0_g1~~TRINITY_DN82189_c0_g1_i1.p1  ORF type:complete len:188 (-),score=41.51 TRINITY_DN82189_c0_g1_i1:57-620(-)
MNGQDVPSFGLGDSPAAVGLDASMSLSRTAEVGNGVAASTGAVEDELILAASVDKVQEVTEQLAEFLVKFSPSEQNAILGPFLAGGYVMGMNAEDELVEAHIDEARKFITHYLAVFSECERDLILEKWRPAFDTASIPSATESFTPTPSVTPTGSITPTAVTPREFLSARREVNETYHSHSPCGETG